MTFTHLCILTLKSYKNLLCTTLKSCLAKQRRLKKKNLTPFMFYIHHLKKGGGNISVFLWQALQCALNTLSWDFPGSPVVKDSVLPVKGAWVWSLVGEVRFNMLCGAAMNEWMNKYIHTYIHCLKNLLINYELHFTDGEIEAQRGYNLFEARDWWSQNSTPSPSPKPVFPLIPCCLSIMT